MNTKLLFFTGLIVAATGVLSPPLALVLGLILGLTVTNPYPADTKDLSKYLLQASVVAMGFGMNLREVVRAGVSGFAYTAGSIAFVMIVGMISGRLLKVRKAPSILIAAGTAICGGSAIAAMGPIIDAEEQEMAVSLGTIFVLSSTALLTFPTIGSMLHLTQSQFGLWTALAMHDTSTVVGAAARYGSIALMVGTTVKLARALWIVPLSFGTAAVRRSGGSKIQIPWFILWFCLASVIATYVPGFQHPSKVLSHLGVLGLTATLYLIGTATSRAMLKQVGVRPFLLGFVVWISVTVVSLWLIMRGVIAF